MKRRLYIRCMRSYAELFSGKKEQIAPEHGAVLKEAYLWNDLMESDQFCRERHNPEGESQDDNFKMMAAEGIKLNLNDMYNATLQMFDCVSAKVALLT